MKYVNKQVLQIIESENTYYTGRRLIFETLAIKYF